ncbi:MAG: hypothetical protein JOZ39_10505, partial [Chloroflexi bacterium]|nr:hypothetical protein [Chloroflexota bacterium]
MVNQSQARSVLDPSMEQRASRLDADQRLELERRRLWVRLSLLAVPVALIAGFGREAYGPSILSGACIFGSYALVSSLLNRRPAVVARFQIELRLLDVALLALCIYEIHVMMLGRAQITGELLFALYVQSVIAAASTDGWLGVAAIASASSIAIVADRLVLQANGYLSGADWGTTIVLPLVVADLTFMISASTVLYLMRVSGHAAARRERGLLH